MAHAAAEYRLPRSSFSRARFSFRAFTMRLSVLSAFTCRPAFLHAALISPLVVALPLPRSDRTNCSAVGPPPARGRRPIAFEPPNNSSRFSASRLPSPRTAASFASCALRGRALPQGGDVAPVLRRQPPGRLRLGRDLPAGEAPDLLVQRTCEV